MGLLQRDVETPWLTPTSLRQTCRVLDLLSFPPLDVLRPTPAVRWEDGIICTCVQTDEDGLPDLLEGEEAVGTCVSHLKLCQGTISSSSDLSSSSTSTSSSPLSSQSQSLLSSSSSFSSDLLWLPLSSSSESSSSWHLTQCEHEPRHCTLCVYMDFVDWKHFPDLVLTLSMALSFLTFALVCFLCANYQWL